MCATQYKDATSSTCQAGGVFDPKALVNVAGINTAGCMTSVLASTNLTLSVKPTPKKKPKGLLALEDGEETWQGLAPSRAFHL